MRFDLVPEWRASMYTVQSAELGPCRATTGRLAVATIQREPYQASRARCRSLLAALFLLGYAQIEARASPQPLPKSDERCPQLNGRAAAPEAEAPDCRSEPQVEAPAPSTWCSTLCTERCGLARFCTCKPDGDRYRAYCDGE